MQKDEVQRLLRDTQLIPSEKLTLLSDIAAQAASLNSPCYIVGGFVRDLLLGKPINDFDIVVEGDAIQLGTLLVKKMGGKLTQHGKFQTAIWHLPASINFQGADIDLVTARSETYKTPGALPSVTPSTIDDDLRRRDFTINAMAIRLDGENFGEVLDPLNGMDDLKKCTIRVLHSKSFVDDPTRILRAIRYEGRYAFKLEEKTSRLINSESLAALSKLSGERIRHELDLMFAEQGAGQMIVGAGYLGLFEKIHQGLPLYNANYTDFLDIVPTLDIAFDRVSLGYIFWMIDLSQDEILSIAKRLDFSADLTHIVWGASKLRKSLPYLVNGKPSAWTFAVEKLPLISIYANYLVSRENALLDFLSLWRFVKPHTTGDDLLVRGLEPGPRYGEILTRLRTAWLDGEVRDLNQEKALLDILLK